MFMNNDLSILQEGRETFFNATDAQHVDFAKFGGRGAPRGSTMVPLGRELVSSHRLSIQTTLVSGSLWPQFAMQVLTGGQKSFCISAYTDIT